MTRHWHLLKTISVTLLCISLQNNLFISSSKAVSQSWRAVAQDWWSNQDPDGKPRGSRDAACLVTPGRDQRLWNNQPLFVWRGDYRVMGIRELGDALLPTKQVATQGRQFKNRYRLEKLTNGFSSSLRMPRNPWMLNQSHFKLWESKNGHPLQPI